MGILIRKIKIPPTHICVIIIVMHEAMWIVVIDRMRMITWCVICWSLYDITSYVICCAKCHFLPFLPASSITMPPSWKMLLS